MKKTIESIVVQPEFLNGNVEIVISDNASNDGTDRMVASFKEKYPGIIYHRNERNIGNENFPLVLSLGNGILRKLNNDTLEFKEKSLNRICDEVNKYQKNRPFLFWSNGELKADTQVTVSFRKFVTSVSYWITWIGGFSIWDNECDNLRDDTLGCEERLWQVMETYSQRDMEEAGIDIKFVQDNQS